MGVVGGYDLHLYCDNPECPDPKYGSPTAQISDVDRAAAFREARKAGWKFPRRMNDDYTRACYCPKCKPPKEARPTNTEQVRPDPKSNVIRWP